MKFLLILIVVLAGALALYYAWKEYRRIYEYKVDNQKVNDLTLIIQNGAMTFLKKEYAWIAPFVLVVSVILMIMFRFSWGISFFIGALCSASTGYIGMYITTRVNGKTVFAASQPSGESSALEMAFRGSSIIGIIIAGVGVLGISLCFLFWPPTTIISFGLGASTIALFARVSGGIFTKAADAGADQAGRTEVEFPGDDSRNPAVIADNVGDNVGDVAGMGADFFESYVNAIIAAMFIGSIVPGVTGVAFPLILSAWGIVASIFGCILVCNSNKLLMICNSNKVLKEVIKYINKIPKVETWIERIKGGKDPAFSLKMGFYSCGIVMILGAFILSILFFGFGCIKVFLSVVSGVLVGVGISFVSEFFTSNDFKPVKDLASSAQKGPAAVMLSGIELGMMSMGIPVLMIVVATFISYALNGVYGVACLAVGMLSITGIAFSLGAFCPISDNAGGIAQMSDMSPEVLKITDKLDSIGNKTAAIGKGLAIGSAALTSMALFIAYAVMARLQSIDLIDSRVMASLLLGGMLPFVFCALSIRAVRRTAEIMIDEIRRQFREITGIKENTAQPEYEKCIGISTQSALNEMILPSVLALASPLLVGLILGKAALGGMLAGAITSGIMLALFLANSGEAWNNAKKHIEEGNFGGKQTPQHEAVVIGDTVGDPFKDTAGPGINILIKLMTIIAILIAPFLS